MRRSGIYVETSIAAPPDAVWNATQDPAEHVRWDVRFTRITPGGLRESHPHDVTITREAPNYHL